MSIYRNLKRKRNVMALTGISVLWDHCPDGVEIFDYPQEPARKNATVIGGPFGQHFRYKSERREAQRFEAVDLSDPIFLRYANARTDDDLRAFFWTYGFRSDVAEVSVELEREAQSRFRVQISEACSGDQDRATAAMRILLDGVRIVPKYMQTADLTPRMVMENRSLHGYMCMEVGTAASNDARLAHCENCGKGFLTGPLTGRRSHAKYCGDRCRVAAMRKRNAGKD